jgi:Tfp pilus assembly protein PilF
VQTDDRFADARLKLSRAYLQSGRIDEAQAGFEAVLELNINAVEAYVSLGKIFADRGEWAHAAAHYDRALLIRPGSEKAREGLEAARTHL